MSATPTVTATATLAGLRSALEDDFARVSSEWADARSRQQHKDTPASRAAVAECSARIDAVLDRWLDARMAA